jgi:hypothetical protein
MHCNENPIYVFLFWELRGLSPNFHIYVSVSDLSQGRSTYFPAAELANRSWEYINRSQTQGCGKLGLCPRNSFYEEYVFRIFGIGSLQYGHPSLSPKS